MASWIRMTMRLELEGSKPTIWRRFELEGTRNFLYFHRVIQVLMAWTNSHLHEFSIGDRNIGMREDDPDATADVENERTIRICDVLSAVGDHATYVYDFGDEWTHQIVVEKVEPYQGEELHSICLDGALAAPPEDCGGVWGYERLLKNLKRARPREDLMPYGFNPRFFDPNHFDPGIADIDLRSIARLPRKKA